MPSKKFVLVSGSRNFPSRYVVRETLRGFLKDGDELMHGCARGVDSWAGEIALEMGIRVHERPADWERRGKSAGIVRNRQMLDETACSENPIVLIFWDGHSNGTKHMLDMCKKAGVPYLLWVQ